MTQEQSPTPAGAGRKKIANWYGTRVHYAGKQVPGYATSYWSLCGKANGRVLADDAAFRIKRGMPAKDYDELPLCKFCQRLDEKNTTTGY